MTDFPRDPYEALSNPKWREVYEGDYFTQVLTDTWAWLTWDYMGIRGGMEKYSGYDPFYMLAHNYELWILLYRAMGVTVERFFNFGPGYELGYLPYAEMVYEYVCPLVDCLHRHTRFDEWLEVVKQHRCHEDYDKRDSGVKKDFYRSWYHTRAKVKVLDFVQVEEPGYYPCDRIDSRLDIERFMERLDEKNRKIVRLLLAGYTQVEIGERLGFANHSGVCKRIKKIGEQYIEYMKP
jgi:hypothetical protein